MKRSLVLLLVVALLAMMIPSMAVAEDVQFTITGSFTKKLDNTEASIGQYVLPSEYDQVAATVTGLGQDYCYVEWTSSDRNVVKIYESGKQYYDLTDPDVKILPEIQIKGAGTAAITGKLFKNYEDVKPTATGTFSAALTAVDLTGFSFVDAEGKELTELTVVVGEPEKGLRLKCEPEGTATYRRNEDFAWSTSDATVVTVDRWGYVNGKKEGTAVVTATSRYYPSLPAKTITIKVEDYSSGTTTKVPFSKVEFSTDKFTVKQGDYPYVHLNWYLTTEPAVCDDEIKWFVSDPSIAEVDDDGNFQFYDNVKDGDTVTVTAQSKLGDKSATATITYEEKKPYEEIHFIKKSFEVTADNNGMSLYNFVNIDKPEDPADGLIFTSANPETIKVEEDGTLWLLEPDTVKITVRSKRNPDKAIDSCTVTFKREALKSIKFTDDVPKKLTQGESLDLWPYVDTDPYYYAHGLNSSNRSYISFKAVSDPQIVNFDWGYYNAYVYGRFPGSTTIVAVFDDGSNYIESAPFTLEVVPVPVTDIIFAKEGKFEIKSGKTITLSDDKYLTLNPDDATAWSWTWTTSDPEIVSLDGCVAKGEKAGTATVTLSIRNADGSLVEKSCEITVKDYALTKVDFENKGNADYFTVNLPRYGASKKLQLKVTPVDADFDIADLHVDSSEQDVATAYIGYDSNDGYYCEVYATKPGKTTLTITSRVNPDIKAKAKVTVKPIELKSVKFQKKVETAKRKLVIPIFEEADLNAYKIKTQVTPSDAYCEYKWETSDASVAYLSDSPSKPETKSNAYVGSDTIDEPYAYIIAVGPGTCKIKVTVTDGTNTKIRIVSVTVKEAKVSKLALNKTTATAYLIKGGDNTLQLEAYDAKTDFAVPVTWASSNKKIATVDKTGLVTFKKAGKVKIAATTKDGNKTKKYCTLTVKQLKVTKITPVKKAITMKVGDEVPLKYTIKPVNAYNSAVTIKSSKPKIVSVDTEGNLTALMPGKAVITIKATDGSKKTAKVTVVVKAAVINDDVKVDAIEDGMDLSFEGNVLDGIGDISNLEINGGMGLTIE